MQSNMYLLINARQIKALLLLFPFSFIELLGYVHTYGILILHYIILKIN